MILSYRNDPKFSDRYAWANSADPDQTAHYSTVEPHSLNFRVITTNFLGVRIFRKFTVGLGKQCRLRSSMIGSTLFAILSASLGCITVWLNNIGNILG